MRDKKERIIEEFERQHGVRILVSKYFDLAFSYPAIRTITLSRELIDSLSPEALEFILFHELEHIRRQSENSGRIAKAILYISGHIAIFMEALLSPIYRALLFRGNGYGEMVEEETECDIKALNELTHRYGKERAVAAYHEAMVTVSNRSYDRLKEIINS